MVENWKQMEIKVNRKLLEVSGHWAWGSKSTDMSSDLFPRIGEDDIQSFLEPDLHLALKPKP